MATLPNNLFKLEEGQDPAALWEQINVHYDLEKSITQTHDSICYDSFDWRLFLQGWQLTAHNKKTAYESGQNTAQQTECWSIILESVDGQQQYARQSLKQVPTFAWDFPDSLLKTQLQPILEMRALLAHTHLHWVVQTWKVLDDEQKTVVRLQLETVYVVGENSEHTCLGQALRVLPVRGYTKALQRVLQIIQAQALETEQKSWLELAWRQTQQQPGSYSSKLNLQLKPDMPANIATKIILQRLLDTMQENEAGTRQNLDSEFLHDFRVAIRRTRSVLSQVKGVLPKTTVTRFKPQFAWLGSVTTPTRDLDVYLLDFDKYHAMLPAQVQPDLAPLLHFLQQHHRQAQQKMAKTLVSKTYQKLIQEWQQFIHSPSRAHPQIPNSGRPVIEVANENIWKAYRKVLKAGKRINDDTPVVALHELRKDCKKLRYLMEFFQSLYPKDRAMRSIKILKDFQNILGDIQDYFVQVEHLQSFAEQMVEEGTGSSRTLLAMGVLVGHLLDLEQQARTRFTERFEIFAQETNRHRFAELFKPQKAKITKVITKATQAGGA
ncbi:CHAD domain-containing protein [Candidatus Venteria ishoeyi]|uniref:CHAD domain protein n=1 Tax=Candidatus Venteria ishoeyi TaxID=1899563 RepID=A0A1H6FEE7_9GAMM|nr:CHAD domain-containing protein [Candidatus Venteria ishoeyi]MDM8544958.1 CHAD domain-containing protein [Candidatus Venteria ishoeyi]SEH07781.1 CHAD domain protein [Candidatus Venteria ishoeyi]